MTTRRVRVPLSDPYAALRGRAVRIWSGDWKAWWRPNWCGYTDNQDQAGPYVFEDAFDRTKHCGPEKKIVFELAGGFDA